MEDSCTPGGVVVIGMEDSCVSSTSPSTTTKVLIAVLEKEKQSMKKLKKSSQLISFNPASPSSPQWVLRMSTTPSSHSQPHSIESDSSDQAQNANLLNYAQLPHDGLTSGPQLPTNLDGSSSYSAGCKDKTPIVTFSWVVKLELGSISGHSLSRTRAEYHIHTPEGHRESTHKVQIGLPDFMSSKMDAYGLIWQVYSRL
ncbi:hypothetical protein Cgig2_014851 [Carnegiea gigantea]|uniref:Uncharacterized protein n=1 Tax=Carnegiea gigantea TaxID=171969 RepID=A0A9Q1QRU6_9CARY|nr:hypothetical protein Cgig2_014851 [Carnegiea gigantea]